VGTAGEVGAGVGGAGADHLGLRIRATTKQVAADVQVKERTIAKWRRRFVEHRLDGLIDEPRPGPPPSILLNKVEEVVVATLEETPKNATHWSRTLMANRVGLSASAVGRIWRHFDLIPHLVDGFKLSTDPQFVAKSSMSLASTTIRRKRRWCSAWMKRVRCRHWTAPSRYYR
jgi:Homeodomain-like domain